MAFENTKGSKKCPLCVYLVKRVDLKRVIVEVIPEIKIGSVSKMNLMVRNKANMIIKNKFLSESVILPV